MRKGFECRRSFMQHTLVNRSDSEKLSDVTLMFKPDVNLQAVFPADAKGSRDVDANSISLEDLEYFDVPQSPYWTSRDGEASKMQSYGRRRSIVSSVTSDTERVVAYRRESRVDGIEDKDERVLEVLREIVRKCSNPDPTLRPTASDILTILNVKTNCLRDK